MTDQDAWAAVQGATWEHVPETNEMRLVAVVPRALAESHGDLIKARLDRQVRSLAATFHRTYEEQL